MNEYVSTTEAGRRLGYTRYHIGRLIRAGKIPASRPFHDWRIKVSDLEAIMRGREGG